MKEQLGDEYESFLAAYEDSNYHGLRINPLKDGDVEKVKSYFTDRPVPWCKTGYYYEEEVRPGRHPYHHAGAYYIQEPSAMLVGELADVRPGMRVLDLCAAPGGKTSHLAGGLKGKHSSGDGRCHSCRCHHAFSILRRVWRNLSLRCVI